MNLTEELTKASHNHWQTTGQPPETLRIASDLWEDLKEEAEGHKMLVKNSDADSGLSFNGMSVTLVESNTFLRWAMQ